MNTFYYGVVESRADPLKLGRCKVRVMGVHTENTTLLPTKDLPWCVPLQPITSAAVSGIGMSPTGVVEGAWVVLFFRDGESYQEPIMIGTVAGIPESKEQRLTDPFQGSTSDVYNGVRDLVDVQADDGSSLRGNIIDEEGTNEVSASSPFGAGNILIQTDNVRTPQSGNINRPVGEATIDANIRTPVDSVVVDQGVRGSTYGRFGIPSYMRDGESTSGKAVDSPILQFVGGSSHKESFRGLVPSTKAFDRKWKEVAAQDPKGFANEQREFYHNTKVVPSLNTLRGEGVDLTSRGPAVQEMIFSTTQQYGSADVIQRALRGKNIATMTDQDIIQAVQDDKEKNLSNDFSKAEREEAGDRIRSELQSLIEQSKNDGSLTREEIDALSKISPEPLAASGVVVPRTIPVNDKDGFQDPNGVYPRKRWIDEQDTSRLARGEKTNDTILKAKNGTLIRNVGTSGGGSWNEPASPYKAQYPLNHVWQTESGHVQEFDDTPNAERIHIYHRAGSFTEYHPDGTVVFKSVKDAFEVVVKDKNVYVGGSCNITVKGDANIYAKGMMNLESDGDMAIRTGGNLYIGAEGRAEVVSNGDLHLGSSGNLHEGAKNIMMNCSWFPSGVSAGDHVMDRIQVQVYDDDEGVPTIGALDEEKELAAAQADGSVAPNSKEFSAPAKGSDGVLRSTQTQPIKELDTLKKTEADTKETKCNGEDATGNDALSTNYRLADLTTSPVLSKVSLKAQAGLTKCEIFDNLSELAKNVMEPLRKRYGNNFIITSAFRQMGSNNRSQHPKGQAVDIQFPQLPAHEYVHRIEEIVRILPDWDQAILEYHGRNPVIHLSYNKEGNRREKKTTPNLRHYFSGFRDRSMGLVYQ